MNRLAPAVLVAASVTVLLAGCGGAGAKPEPVAATGSPTTALSSPAPSTVPPSTAALPAPSSQTENGCSANGGSIPAGAPTADIGDIDNDGKADTEFWDDSAGGLGYGIQTASGATIALTDAGLASPKARTGWTARMETGPILTVVDDGRTATLHALVDCKYVTPKGDNGQPYTFALAGFGQYGTGVECSGGDTRGGRVLMGVLAAQQPDGGYLITKTPVYVSDDGQAATNDAPLANDGTHFAADSTNTKLAMTSSCEDVPVVTTSAK